MKILNFNCFSSQPIVRGLKPFVNKYKLPPLRKETRLQMQEIEGLQAFNQGLYHNSHYENLIQYLCEQRQLFKSSSKIEEKQTIANNKLEAFQSYVQKRSQNLPEEFKLNEKMKDKLKQSYELYCERQTRDISPPKLLEMHNAYSDTFKFDVPIHPRLLMQMIYPHMGYLLKSKSNLSLEEIIKIYEYKTVASFENSLGQTLLCNEISSLAYWNLFTKKGYLNGLQFADFMRQFGFNLININDVKKEFEFAQTVLGYPFEDEIIEFDQFRYIFLERNL